MAEIEKLLEKMEQRGIDRMVLINDQPIRLYAGERQAVGPTVPLEQLRNLVLEVLPADLYHQVEQNGSFQFPYHSTHGTFKIALVRADNSWRVVVTTGATDSTGPQQPLFQEPLSGSRQPLPAEPENTSGRGNLAELPAELKGFNWGAFFIPFIWCIVHKDWAGLGYAVLALILGFPTLGIGTLVMCCVISNRANKVIWQNRRWNSIEEFRDTQRIWAFAGAVVFVLQCFSLYWSLYGGKA